MMVNEHHDVTCMSHQDKNGHLLRSSAVLLEGEEKEKEEKRKEKERKKKKKRRKKERGERKEETIIIN